MKVRGTWASCGLELQVAGCRPGVAGFGGGKGKYVREREGICGPLGLDLSPFSWRLGLDRDARPPLPLTATTLGTADPTRDVKGAEVRGHAGGPESRADA